MARGGRRSLGTRALLAVALVVALAAAPFAASPTSDARLAGSYTFVSLPDFFNNDLADVSGSPYWHEGDPNSIDASYATAIDTVLDDVAAAGARDVLVPGDVADGHWGKDTAGTGIFGPLGTTAQKVASVRLAARTYLGAYQEELSSRGLRVFPAVGDHDLGDNPWTVGTSAWHTFKHDHLQVWRSEWARQFTAGGTRFSRRPRGTAYDASAYATYLTPNVLLISVDVFARTRTRVVERVRSGQLTWMEHVLRVARANHVPWVIVEGHVPVLEPVRHRHSSDLRVAGGRTSAFWRLMRSYRVDLYLCGEVHDTTAITPRGGPVQISHGGLVNHGETTFLRGRVADGVMRIDVLGWKATVTPAEHPLWEPDAARAVRNNVVFEPGAHVLGTMRLTKDGSVLSRTGVLTPYHPAG